MSTNDAAVEIPAAICNPEVRSEFVYIFEVIRSNPNGDPDAMNAPRTIPDTGHGLVTDVSIKRKVRDYVSMASDFEIFIDSDIALNEKIEKPAKTESPSLIDEKKGGWYPKLQAELCRRYFDIRMFGAVLMTGDYNAGKVTGPVQLNFAMSLSPVTVKFNAGSQKGRRTVGDFQEGETEFGITTPIIPYGVYRTHGFFNPFFAAQTGVSNDDLRLFWEAMVQAFALSRSRSRPEINVRGLSVFSHDNKLGKAPAHKLLERINFQLREGVNSPQKFSDYDVRIDDETLPDGVTLTHLVDPRE